MTVPFYARIAARLLGREDRAPVRPPTGEQRTAAISAIALALASRARARRRNRWLGGIATAAAFSLVAGGAVRELSHRGHTVTATATAPASAGDALVVGYPVAGAASVVALGAPAPLADRRALPAGSRVVTPPGGRVMLAFATGTEVLLGEGADMTIADEGTTQSLRIDRGSLDLHVAKLSADRRFVVQTPDAEIEVRGTAFRVYLAPADAVCGSGTPTRVDVSEGIVVVRHAGQETRVEAGQRWPSGCAQTARANVGWPASSVARTSRTAASSVAVAALSPASSLGEQNDMFADAMAAKRRGATGEALDDFDRFLARYPGSPLAENAIVERMRLLNATGSSRAPLAAKQYLARYPNGFARSEAEVLVAGSP
jgi:ferric-dicitrate binding protein FerR (iron transport regulator)